MNYCQQCILPDTRPNLILNEDGICNACLTHSKRVKIDWSQRKKQFQDILSYAQKNSHGYDCLIPVSGGKDSTWQVVKCLEYGLNPLAVTWKAPLRTKLGEDNLTNLVNLGVDHIDYQINPKTERKFLYKTLVQYGTPAIPMHMAIFNISLTTAVRYKIPVVIWGENSASEYGGSEKQANDFRMNEEWLQKYGIGQGTTVKDWISEDLTEKELTPYFAPSEEELTNAGVLAIFLGHFFPWDPETSLSVAKAHGFQVRSEGPKTGLYNYADIDDDLISIHHYLKWYKFGFTRLFDNLSLEIRNKRMTRDQAIAIVKKYGEQRPDEDIEKLCAFLDITRDHFFDVIEKFRNLDIWKQKNEKWTIKNYLISDWEWKS